jgi:hypothetical protein
MNEEPKKKKPILIIAGLDSSWAQTSKIEAAINSVLEKDSRGIVIVNVDDIKEVDQSLLEKLNEKVYEITPLPQIKDPVILREFKQKKNWYEGKHKKHRK